MSDNLAPVPSPSEMTVDDRQVQEQAAKVNQLLRELESKLDNNQHAVVTELLAERAVLGAMRAHREIEQLKSDSTTQETITNNAFSQPVTNEQKGES